MNPCTGSDSLLKLRNATLAGCLLARLRVLVADLPFLAVGRSSSSCQLTPDQALEVRARSDKGWSGPCPLPQRHLALHACAGARHSPDLLLTVRTTLRGDFSESVVSAVLPRSWPDQSDGLRRSETPLKRPRSTARGLQARSDYFGYFLARATSSRQAGPSRTEGRGREVRGIGGSSPGPGSHA